MNKFAVKSYKQLNIQISQGSAATDLRPGGGFNSGFFRSSSLISIVEELVQYSHSRRKNICRTFYVHVYNFDVNLSFVLHQNDYKHYKQL